MILDNSKVVDQTAAINRVETVPSLISSLGLFRDSTVGSDAITFDVKANSLTVLDDSLRNTRNKNSMEDQEFDMHTLAIPHYAIENTIGRTQLAGVRGFGAETEKAVNVAVAEELVRQAERHDNHEEYLKALMLFKGQIDTNFYGSIDMAAEFNVTRPTNTIAAADDLAAKLRAIVKQSKDALKNGGRVRGYMLFAGADLFDLIAGHADAKAAFTGAGYGNNPLLNELGEAGAGYSMFRLGNVDVILYDDTFTKADGTAVEMLANNAGLLVPRTEIGSAFFGPVSKLSGVGSMGAKRFASSYRDPKDRYIEVESEQNTLVVNQQYGATVAITAA